MGAKADAVGRSHEWCIGGELNGVLCCEPGCPMCDTCPDAICCGQQLARKCENGTDLNCMVCNDRTVVCCIMLTGPNFCTLPNTHSEDTTLNDTQTVNVVYTATSKHLGGLLASMLSVSRHIKDPQHLDFYVIVHETAMPEAQRLVDVFRQEMKMWPAVPNVLLQRLRKSVMNFAGHMQTRRWPKTLELYNHYYIHEYLPQHARRAVWVDTDMILMDDITVLHNLKMTHAVGATPDRYDGYGDIALMESLRDEAPLHFAHHFSGLNLSAARHNFGMLVYDLDKWRLGDITKSLESLTEQLSGWRS